VWGACLLLRALLLAGRSKCSGDLAFNHLGEFILERRSNRIEDGEVLGSLPVQVCTEHDNLRRFANEKRWAVRKRRRH
jgi:hypothetical protein